MKQREGDQATFAADVLAAQEKLRKELERSNAAATEQARILADVQTQVSSLQAELAAARVSNHTSNAK
jgi:predicted  nucleic acid-binding Zn-ribbon protein